MPKDLFVADVLAGKSVLTSGGLGLEISKALAGKGATVHICGRRANVLEAAAKEIGEHAHWHGHNVRDPELVDTIMKILLHIKGLTGLINNAAANFIASTKGLSPRGCRAITSTVVESGQHLAQPRAFSDLNRLSDEQCDAAREAIKASNRD
jgi:NADP-dependent 3-hydroxy acid dehydrogenase YdfG